MDLELHIRKLMVLDMLHDYLNDEMKYILTSSE